MAPPTRESADRWRVVCLCADWCGVCRSFRSGFDAAAGRHPGADFVWVDVEDESELMGDVDIETFPTLLIARGSEVRFFGSALPSPEHLERLLASLHDSFVAVDPEAQALLARLARRFPVA